MTNLLFICSRNQWRSPTAERLFRRRAGLRVRSAGTSPKARRRVGETDLRWADVVMVMEGRHRRQLNERFGQLIDDVTLFVLDIPDDYRFMDPELIEMLEEQVPQLLEQPVS